MVGGGVGWGGEVVGGRAGGRGAGEFETLRQSLLCDFASLLGTPRSSIRNSRLAVM